MPKQGKNTYRPPTNDRISAGLDDIVPEKYRGTDSFLDIVNWNIRWFNSHEPKRVQQVAKVLEALNADIIVLQEIEFGSLEPVAQKLRKSRAGDYRTAYGTTGGDQRVAIMYDFEWVRAKDDVAELFGKKTVLTPQGKDVFPRLPLWGNLTGLPQINTPEEAKDKAPFDFQLVGLHLKSQLGGGQDQRKLAAERLGRWLTEESPKVDEDVIFLGDWNEPPDSDTWRNFHTLEGAGKLAFKKLNDQDTISHLMYRNKSEIGSRLDLTALSGAADKVLAQGSEVVRWKTLDALLKTNPQAKQIKEYIKQISKNLSDHMPVVTRFYIIEEGD